MLLKENWGSEFYKQVVKAFQVFPDGSVVKNPPANAGDTDSIPGLGISHMPWSNKAHATTPEPVL